MGLVYIFSYVAVNDKPTRYKYIFYYSICFVENCCSIVLWITNSENAGTWWFLLLPMTVFGIFALGILCFSPHILIRDCETISVFLQNNYSLQKVKNVAKPWAQTWSFFSFFSPNVNIWILLSTAFSHANVYMTCSLVFRVFYLINAELIYAVLKQQMRIQQVVRRASALVENQVLPPSNKGIEFLDLNVYKTPVPLRHFMLDPPPKRSSTHS